MQAVEALFVDLDRQWLGAKPVLLTVIGSAALMLQTDYARGTKDSDVLQTTAIDTDTAVQLKRLGGVGTPLHRQHGMYVDIVGAGIPFLAQRPQCVECEGLNGELRRLRVQALSVADVVVSKLKRFSASDIRDIEAMADGGHVRHEEVLDRFLRAADVYAADARAEDLPSYVRHLHRIERDLFGVPPSEIELPAWI